MLNGDNSIFSPTGSGNVGQSDENGFSEIKIPKNGFVNLISSTPAELTHFDIRVNEICFPGNSQSTYRMQGHLKR